MNALFFIVGEIVNKGIPFLLLPFFTHYLSVTQYGEISSFMAYTTFLQAFLLWGQSSIIPIKSSNGVSSENRFLGVFETIIFVSMITFFSINLFSLELSRYFSLRYSFLIVGLLTSLSQALIYLFLINYQSEKKAVHFVIYSIFLTLMGAAFSVLGFMLIDRSSDVRIYSLFMSSIFVLIVISFFNKKIIVSSILNSQISNIKLQLKYGFSLILHILSTYVKNILDRVLIVSMIGLEALGHYSVTIQFGSAISILAAAMNRYLSQKVFDLIAQKKDTTRINITCFGFIISVSIFYYVVINIIGSNIVGNKFTIDSVIFSLTVLSGIVQFLYFMASNYLFYYGYNRRISAISVFSVLIHSIMMVIFIKYNGAVGAAYANLLSWILMFILTIIQYVKVCYGKGFS